MSSNKRLKLGWILPYSGIFRNLKKDLQQGLDMALQKEETGMTVEVCCEYIESGALKPTEDALKKLLTFEQVDLVVGITSSKVALSILPLAGSNKTPVIILNLGADIPVRALCSDYLFYNSLHLWKSEWVMGKWAQEKYGGEPSINMSVYEGGYGLHESFKAGTAVSGAQTVKLNILRNIYAPTDTSALLEHLRVQQTKHAHILLSGKEGEQFLQLFHDQPPGNEMGLTANPFMTEEGLAADLPPGLQLYNAMTWSPDLDSKENRLFMERYAACCEEPPHAFSLLAYETGLALASALRALPAKIDRKDLAAALRAVRVAGPRGRIGLSTRPIQTDLPVYIRQPVTDPLTGKTTSRIVSACTGIEWDDRSLQTEQVYLSGWQNPYLCV